jgi:transposase-like protein
MKRVTDNELKEAVLTSTSMGETLKKLGRIPHGNMYNSYAARARSAGIDTSHFVRVDTKNNLKSKPSMLLPEVLKIHPKENLRVSTLRLRKAMFSVGVLHKCAGMNCKVGNSWNGRELVLEIDHINGEKNDNRIENLRFLCPNCHSQTDTFRNKKKWECEKCGSKVTRGSKTLRCRGCSNRPTSIEWPSIEQLLESLESTSVYALGKSLGVNGNSVKKHLKKHGVWVPRKRGPEVKK